MWFIPPTRAFGLKRILYRWCGVSIGNNSRIVSSAMIIGNGELSIGENTWIGHNVLIQSSSSISIGRNCDIAPNVYIGTGTHKITPDLDRIAGVDLNYNITIDDGCWIGAGACILPGVNIGKMNVVGAGAIVNRSFEDYNLIVGVPAQSIRKIK